MDEKEHIERHKMLHQYLDELLVDFFLQINKPPSETMVMELVEWSQAQIENPTELKNEQ